MDALDLIVLALRIALVALLYLFLLVVLRLAMAGLAPPRSRSETAADALHLVVLEPGDSALHAGQVVRLADGATLGRAQRANLVVADPTVSAEHARVDRVDRNGWSVTDLGSTNGTHVNDRRVQATAPLADGDVLALGTVRLRVRAR